MMWLLQTILMLTGAVTISCFAVAVLILCVAGRRRPEPMCDHREIQEVADELTEHDRVPMAWEHWETWPTVLK